jgi:hypothetical protein
MHLYCDEVGEGTLVTAKYILDTKKSFCEQVVQV